MSESVDTLVKQLFAADAEARVQAAEELGQRGEGAQSAAIALVGAMADPAEEVREAASSALESLGPPTLADASGLMKLLSEGNTDVAFWSATLLGRLGSSAVRSVPALIRLVTNEGAPAVRERAAWALGQIGPAAKEAADALEQAALHPSPRLARLAQEALEQIRA